MKSGEKICTILIAYNNRKNFHHRLRDIGLMPNQKKDESNGNYDMVLMVCKAACLFAKII